MRKGSRVTIEKADSGFHGKVGTIRHVDRGPSAFDIRKVRLEGFEISVWYLIELDDKSGIPIGDGSVIPSLGISEEGCMWFRAKEVIPLRSATAGQ